MPWYYARNGQRFGPVEEDEIHRLAGAGQLGPADLTWKPGMPSWRPAGEVPELAFLFRSRPAAPPPPPAPPPYAPPPAAQTSPPPPAGTLYSPPPSSSPQGGFSPYAPPSAPLTAPPPYRNEMFSTVLATEYASFGSRFAAVLLDQILLFFVVGALTLVAGGSIAGEQSPEQGLMWNGISLVITWLYFAGMESSGQMATLGKRALGLRVTDLDGERISFGRATGRHFGKILSGLALCIGYLVMISDARKQTWHDKMAGCVVIKG